MGEIDKETLDKLNESFTKIGVSASYMTNSISAWNRYIKYVFGFDTPSWRGRKKIAARKRLKRLQSKCIGYLIKYRSLNMALWGNVWKTI